MMITIDHRERASGIIDLLKQEAGVSVDVKNMAHGDYVINDSIRPSTSRVSKPAAIQLPGRGKLYEQATKSDPIPS
jgi:hypothetical protein